jgi:hypothetical protein
VLSLGVFVGPYGLQRVPAGSLKGVGREAQVVTTYPTVLDVSKSLSFECLIIT